MGLYSSCLGWKILGKNSWNTQVVTPLTYRYISWSLTISCRISSSGSEPSNWSCLTSISCGVWWWILHSYPHYGRHNIPKLDISCTTQLKNSCTRKYFPKRSLVHSRYWGISQEKSKLWTECRSRECHIVVVRTTCIRKSRQIGNACLWIDRTGSLKHRWELPVLHYHQKRVRSNYHYFVVM